MQSSPPKPTPAPILFYDGECGFCNASVQFVLRHEATPVLSFAPLQGETAAHHLPASGLPPDIGQHTIVLFEGGKFLVRSRAAVRVMQHMGGKWRTLGAIARLVPAPLADLIYRFVARNRTRLPAGQSCKLLPAHQRQRFLP